MQNNREEVDAKAEEEEEVVPPSILAWRDDVAQWVHSCRADIVGQWHQPGACEAVVDDIVDYLLDAWYAAGETTCHLLGEPELQKQDEEEEEEEEEDAGDDAPDRKRKRRDKTEGQVELATVLAEWIVRAEFADVPPRSVVGGGEQEFGGNEDADAKTTAALQWIDAANRELAAQRTAAWRHARSQLFSASSLSKLLSTPAQYNALVFEKCLAMCARRDRADRAGDGGVVVAPREEEPDLGPRKLRYRSRPPDAAPMRRAHHQEHQEQRDDADGDDERQWTAPVYRRVQDARNWGTKMEPMSAALYCHRNGGAEGNAPQLRTDLGCLRHREHAFLGASPDGVVVGPPGHPKRGYNVEIKNIVDRPITGDPKPEYYVQFQTQMEVCDLEHTDFLETKFREYEFAEDYFLRQKLRPDLLHGIVLHFWPEQQQRQSRQQQQNDAVFTSPEEEDAIDAVDRIGQMSGVFSN